MNRWVTWSALGAAAIAISIAAWLALRGDRQPPLPPAWTFGGTMVLGGREFAITSGSFTSSDEEGQSLLTFRAGAGGGAAEGYLQLPLSRATEQAQSARWQFSESADLDEMASSISVAPGARLTPLNVAVELGAALPEGRTLQFDGDFVARSTDAPEAQTRVRVTASLRIPPDAVKSP